MNPTIDIATTRTSGSIVVVSKNLDTAIKELAWLLDKHNLGLGRGGEATCASTDNDQWMSITFRYPKFEHPIVARIDLSELEPEERRKLALLHKVVRVGLGVLDGKLNPLSNRSNGEILMTALTTETEAIVHSDERGFLFPGHAHATA